MEPKEINAKPQSREDAKKEPARRLEMPADELDEFERLGNAAIHELVFAYQFATQDDYESALTCLTQVHMNAEQMSLMAVKYDPANPANQGAEGTTENTENTEGEKGQGLTVFPPREANPNGLHLRYHIRKANGEPVDPQAEYFVLRLDDGGKDARHVSACRAAALRYAELITDHLPGLAADLQARYGTQRREDTKGEAK